MAKRENRQGFVVLGLALRDLWHERILSLNVILALAAIIAPLLIVLGLKEGLINHLRDNLIEDPVNREIRPQTTQDIPENWFEQVRSRDDVAFVVPGILRGASIVRAYGSDGEQSKIVDLLPSGNGDPLLVDNGTDFPAIGEVVISTPLAKGLGFCVNDTPCESALGVEIRLRVTRTSDGQPEFVEQMMQIAGVLGLRGDSLDRIYAPLQFVLDVESYKEGKSVLHRGWPGKQPQPYPSYDGVFILAEETISPIERSELTISTGFSTLKQISHAEFEADYGFSPPEDFQLLKLGVLKTAVQSGSIRQVANKLRGKRVLILPYVNPFEILLEDESRHIATGYTVSEQQAQNFGLPWVDWDGLDLNPAYQSFTKILLTRNSDPQSKISQLAAVQSLDQIVRFPIEIAGKAPGKLALVPINLAGMLRTGVDRRIEYSELGQALLLGRLGFRGYRIYAKTIDDVPAIAESLRADGFQTINKAQQIIGLQQFSAGLDRIFFLVALVGIIGGVAALVASLYAAVQRKQRDISVMRLIGLSPGEVSRFPIYQGLTTALMSTAVACGVLYAVGIVINRALADRLSGDPAVYLKPDLMLVIMLLVLTAAFCSSLFAAFKTTRIEPAEALRDE